MMILALCSAAMAAPSWQTTLERVQNAVVSIRVTATRDFGTEDAGVSQGTGFVVDAERGILLTNRHMVHAGPVVSEAIFLENERVALTPIYRDPVHDFGFYTFDPDEVRHTPLVELPLAPEGARVGAEIRVIGNDAGEKISILDGTLSRIDRPAPDYGRDSYNDFNTFYIQAATNTSGGSSGSPVIDVRGRVVALNAGGATWAASSFYLPLDRVVRAFERIRGGAAVPRGTLQTVFGLEPFDELGRLGLPSDLEQTFRARDRSRGMLEVKEVLPDGPVADVLQPGDILVSLNGRPIDHFSALESWLDEHVGASVTIEFVRDGVVETATAEVQDLHAITPDRYLEVSRGILHPLSYHLARNNRIPVAGVYLAAAGHMWSEAGVPEGAILTHVDGVATPDLDAMRRVLESHGDGDRLRVRFHVVDDDKQPFETSVVMERRWNPMQQCVRNDATGLWDCEDAPPPPASAPPESRPMFPIDVDERVARRIARGLVMVDFDVPHPTAGVKDANYRGVGVILDAERGLVLVDRDTVPVRLGDLQITFGGSLRVPGRVRYLHPVHNVAVVQYDPAHVAGVEVLSIELAEEGPDEDDRIWLVGLDGSLEVVTRRTTIEDRQHLHLRATPATPRFRDVNLTGLWLEDTVETYGGVLVDRRGRMVAMWASFVDQAEGSRGFYGMPVEFLHPVLDPLLAGREPRYRSLGVELLPLSLNKAGDRGLSDVRMTQRLDAEQDERFVYEVLRVHGTAPADALLRPTDLVLDIDGKPLHDASDLEAWSQRESVKVTLLRDAEELTVEVPTVELAGRGVDRIVSWAGLIVHEPHYEVEAQQGIAAEGVYVAWLWYGSPAERHGIRPTRRIVAIDGRPTPTLDAFLATIAGRADRESVRVTTEGRDGVRIVKPLELDRHYWPARVLEEGPKGWVRYPAVQRAAEAGPEPSPTP
ncbi:MAG: trypsin-like peptidase domain-containing protein [Myxococcota bacterium]